MVGGKPMDGKSYLILKRDLYYRPDACGYTGIKDHAGRYTLAEAQSRANDEVSFLHEDEAPDYTKACFHDLKAEHLEGKLKAALDEIKRLRAALPPPPEGER